MVVEAFNPTLGRQRQADLWEFQERLLVYIANSRPPGVHRETFSQREKK